MQFDESMEQTITSFCYIFPATGIDNLKLGFTANSGVFFIQEKSGLPFPRNGFFDLDRETARYTANEEYYRYAVDPANNPIKTSLEGAHAFLSLGNAHRIANEHQNAPAKEYEHTIRLYEASIRLSSDDSAVKIYKLIADQPDKVSICYTDDDITNLVPEPIRMAVAEAFAGLSLCAIRQRRWAQAIGYSVAALGKHPSALPFVNGARIVSVVLGNFDAVLSITEAAIVPYYLRANKTELYDKEIALWKPEVVKSFHDLSLKIHEITKYMNKRYEGRYCVIKGSLDDVKVRMKKCQTCSKCSADAKFCSLCKKVCYCSKECQKVDWPSHKKHCKK